MFQGELGKKMMIQQGYVPPTCTLPVELAGPLIWSEVNAGRDACAGCNEDRSKCGGRPKTDQALKETITIKEEDKEIVLEACGCCETEWDRNEIYSCCYCGVEIADCCGTGYACNECEEAQDDRE